MDTEQLFCWTMQDLDACIRSTWRYHQLRIAGLVRLLTFDENPLALQINREHRLAIQFAYYEAITNDGTPSEANETSIGPLSYTLANLNPRTLLGTGRDPATAKLDAWLRLGALRLGNRVLSVKEFVEQMAYVEGLVHAGKPSDEFERDLLTMRALRRADTFSRNGYDLLRQIGRITHQGLKPLFTSAQKKHSERDGEYPEFAYG